MSVPNYIASVFGAKGMLASQMPGYLPRPEQIRMAEAVDEAIEHKSTLIAEGPVGLGKSLAYAVPAVYHTHHNPTETGRVVIVTANIALQEQLVRKDLPLLRKVLPWPFTFALMKGLGNFLCRDALDAVEKSMRQQSFDPRDVKDQAQLLKIAKWGASTSTGDKTELGFEPGPLWRRFVVDGADCTGSKCPFFKNDCHGINSRREARKAKIVVTNYHVLFSHLAYGDILGNFDCLIMDEGHDAAEIGRDFFGAEFSRGQFFDLGRAIDNVGLDKERLLLAANEFFGDLAEYRESDRYNIRVRIPDVVEPREIVDALDEVLDVAQEQTRNCSNDAEGDDEIAALEGVVRRASRLKNIRKVIGLDVGDAVVYIERLETGKVKLGATPVSVAKELREALFANDDFHPAVIVTSATLASNNSFDFVASELGIDSYQSFLGQSPFDYENQALLVAPKLPDPKDAPQAYDEEIPRAFAEAVIQAQGRTLGLFTSYRVLNMVYEHLVSLDLPYKILRQGGDATMQRTQLMETFRKDVSSVLLGTTSFWTGVDIPGESLSCLVIDRLPFPHFQDPVLDLIRSRNPEWFRQYAMPKAVIDFKQGAGRLIRAVTDRGVVVVLDSRIRAKFPEFWRNLPSMPRVSDVSAIGPFLNAGGAP